MERSNGWYHQTILRFESSSPVHHTLSTHQIIPLPSGYTYLLTLLVMYVCLSFMLFQLLLYLSTYTPRQVDYLLLVIVVVNLVHLAILNLTTSLTLNYISSCPDD